MCVNQSKPLHFYLLSLCTEVTTKHMLAGREARPLLEMYE